MDFKKFGNFNWIEMDSKDQNLDLTRTKWIYFCPFQSIFVCWNRTIKARIFTAGYLQNAFWIRIS